MSRILQETILSVEELAPSMIRMVVRSSWVAENAVPGQFVNIKCGDGINALLRRPISICDIDKLNQTFTVVFAVKGTGTDILSHKKPGETLDVMAPLGNGFDLSLATGKAVLVGGGIGTFPLLSLSKNLSAPVVSHMGFRNAELVVLEDDFRQTASELTIYTDDGSYGRKGLVVQGLRETLQAGGVSVVYACGPTPMLKAVAHTAAEFEVACQVSMEQRMGCGIGACLVCACKTRLGDAWEYSHVCADGPVFDARDVIFE